MFRGSHGGGPTEMADCRHHGPGSSGSDWASRRGDRWLAHVCRHEAMQAPMDASLIQSLRLVAPRRIADVGCGVRPAPRSRSRARLRRQHRARLRHLAKLIEHARARVGSEGPSFEVADVRRDDSRSAFDRGRLALRRHVLRGSAAASRTSADGCGRAGASLSRCGVRPPTTAGFRSAREVVAAWSDPRRRKADSPGPFRYADGIGCSGSSPTPASPNSGSRTGARVAIGGGLPPAEAAASPSLPFPTSANSWRGPAMPRSRRRSDYWSNASHASARWLRDPVSSRPHGHRMRPWDRGDKQCSGS